MVQRFLIFVVAAALVAGSCGGSEPTVSEYAAELEVMVLAMNSDLDGINVEIEGGPGIEGVRYYAERRIEIRNEFLSGVESLEPPERLRDFHDEALGVVRRLTGAETTLAEYALAADSIEDVEGLWESDAGLAARAVDVESIALCKAAEEELNTEEDAVAAGVPWIPAEMKEIVRVAFLCERSDRP